MNNFDPILESINTTQEAVQIINSLEQIRQQAFKLKSNLNTKMETLLPAAVFQKLTNLCKTEKIESREELVRLLQKLQTVIQSTPKLSLTLSFNPSEKTLKSISKWIIENINQRVFLEINFEPKLIGGAQIVFNNHFKDYSVSKSLEKINFISAVNNK